MADYCALFDAKNKSNRGRAPEMGVCIKRSRKSQKTSRDDSRKMFLKTAVLLISCVAFCHGQVDVDTPESSGNQFQHPSQYFNQDVGLHHHGLKGLSSVTKPIVQLLKSLNRTQIESLFDIFQNQDLTKNQVRQQVQTWASDQGAEVQEEFQQVEAVIDQLTENITAYFDSRAADLSQSAQDVYAQYKAVYQNGDLTPTQECQEIGDITRNITDSSVVNELIRAFGVLPRCGKRHRGGAGRGGFGRFQQSFTQNALSQIAGGSQGQNSGFREARSAVDPMNDPFSAFRMRQGRNFVQKRNPTSAAVKDNSLPEQHAFQFGSSEKTAGNPGGMGNNFDNANVNARYQSGEQGFRQGVFETDIGPEDSVYNPDRLRFSEDANN